MKKIDQEKCNHKKRRMSLTELHRATLGRDIEKMKNLLDAGVDINAQDDDGFTAAHYAAHRWDVNPDSIEPDTLELLLQYKANISIKANNGMTPLHLATSAKAVQLLLDAGADISAITNNGKTPLCTAKEVGTIYAVNALIARGAGLGVRSLEID